MERCTTPARREGKEMRVLEVEMERVWMKRDDREGAPRVRHWAPEVWTERREVRQGGKKKVMWKESCEASRAADIVGVCSGSSASPP